MAGSAFTAVPVRRNFSSTSTYTTQAPPPPPPPSHKKVEWPEPLRQYVQRSFQDNDDVHGVSKEAMTLKLKEIINTAAEGGKLDVTDWAAMPLPQQFILQDRSRLSFQPSAAPVAFAPVSFDVQSRNHAPTDLNNSRKRKSSEYESDASPVTASVATPPWRTGEAKNPFEDRLTFPDAPLSKRQEKKQKKFVEQSEALKSRGGANGDLERRRQRFGAAALADISTRPAPLEAEAPAGPVVGTCEELEKRYFRLTAPPKPETVRPLRVLRKTLDLLKKKWKSENNYNYICDQFKSLRQDLTVQRIRNDFTVQVYEIHARIALEKGDLGEYNQCQTQLRALHKQKLGGHPGEFLAYRILYFIYTSNRPDLNSVLADLTPADRSNDAVQHALQARSALALGNYHRFFKLYIDTPNMGAYLMDMFIVRERLAALAKLCRAYKPAVDLGFIAEELAFESEQGCAEFLCEHGGEAFLDRKEDGVKFATAKAMSVFEQARQAAFRSVDIKGQI